MRILIYLLAMLTGFSAAEAARPVSAAPTSVDAVERAYAAASVTVAKQLQVGPAGSGLPPIVRSVENPAVDAFRTVASTSPVLRHDVILG